MARDDVLTAAGGGVPPADSLHLIDLDAERPSLWSMLIAIVAYRELVRNLVLKDLKLKYRGSVFGFLWSLANPLMLTAVYTLAFRYILRLGQAGFPFFVLLGVLAWTFFANSAIMSTGAIVESGSLVKAVRFPRAILPIATVLFNLAQYVLSVVVLLPMMFLLYRLPPVGPMLLFPVFLTLQLAFTIGVALALALATTWFRDVRHFVDIALPMIFWTTPIVYPLTQVPVSVRWLVKLSPMSPFIVAYQRIFYDGTWPDRTTWLAAGIYAAGMLAAGGWWFMRAAERMDEQLS